MSILRKSTMARFGPLGALIALIGASFSLASVWLPQHQPWY